MKILNHTFFKCLLALLTMTIVFACSGSDDEKEIAQEEEKENEEVEQEETPIYTFNKPCITWGTSMTAVKEQMSKYNLLHEDSQLLIYEGDQTESLISYAFNEANLFATSVYIESSSTTMTDLKQAFIGYSESSDAAAYFDETTYTIGEITTSTFSGSSYYCVSWCNSNLLIN